MRNVILFINDEMSLREGKKKIRFILLIWLKNSIKRIKKYIIDRREKLKSYVRWDIFKYLNFEVVFDIDYYWFFRFNCIVYMDGGERSVIIGIIIV